ncbi:F0F1 ATP synthase subunit gamma [Halomonas sp. McH1-25]|uniref:F0F1 ATP synthase subunit gamma n=1 Tax=unclassified Halomonas TaxID=2609666 RepID=UPI001EF5648F|nr:MULTISPECIES: FoF1 ATP synthase subunit gamma [unclassified Halomonas]MCG7600893.1 F0F1 ATP synthase subunit gamma [Halomonas sp. McH1-25]MCP1341481.1 F0F1 ATP synthase subunit gamma [Halomonas sp. FL8]MCP1360072.1 F0F1 ATP synthase subunit gamma [Halomonas sp. BBD45]
MSGHLNDVTTHLGTTHELGLVIAAMRGIAAARSREAQQYLQGIRTYADTIGTAIGEALTLLDTTERLTVSSAKTQRHLRIVLCAEQGFAGSFSERILAMASESENASENPLFLVGERGLQLAAEQSITPTWSASMAIHPDAMPSLAGHISDALYAQLDHAVPTRVTLIYALPDGTEAQPIVSRPLLPFDYSRFPATRHARPPHVTLPPTQLIASLAEEYVYAELHEALMLSFAAENEARMQSMVTAQSNIEQRRDTLLAEFRSLRQEEITEEIIELSASRLGH